MSQRTEPKLVAADELHGRSRAATKDLNDETDPLPTSARTIDEEVQPQADDVWIAVMGMTGAGKSTFISLLVGDDIGIGYGLESKTRQLGVYRCESLFNRVVWLVDTPGFDDTTRTDAETLRDIATFFAQLYHHNIRFSGVLYLHRITDPRMSGAAIKNLELFKLLCGEAAYPTIRLVTTQWNLLCDEAGRNLACEREQQLIDVDRFFKTLLAGGSRMLRLETPEVRSAKAIVESVLDVKKKHKLAIQFEMVTQKLRLDETFAGQFLERDKALEKAKCDAELHELEESMEEALKDKDRQALDEIAAEKDNFLSKRERLAKEKATLVVDYQQLLEHDLRQMEATKGSDHTQKRSDSSDEQSSSHQGHHEQQDKLHHVATSNYSSQRQDQPSTDVRPQRRREIRITTITTSYPVLHAGTLRGSVNSDSAENKLDKVKRWLSKTLT